MWDYLRRSNASGNDIYLIFDILYFILFICVCVFFKISIGFLVPLSGGADSASVAAIIHVMSHLVTEAANTGDKTVINDLNKLLNSPKTIEDINTNNNQISYSSETLTNKILHTVYMGTINSTNSTRNRAEILAHEISSYHKSFFIDDIVSAVGKKLLLL